MVLNSSIRISGLRMKRRVAKISNLIRTKGQVNRGGERPGINWMGSKVIRMVSISTPGRPKVLDMK